MSADKKDQKEKEKEKGQQGGTVAKIWKTLASHKDLAPVKPLYILTYGPPASGKSTLLHYLVPLIRPALRLKDMIEINPDAIIDQIPAYKKEMSRMKKLHDDDKLDFEDFASRARDLYDAHRPEADQILELFVAKAMQQKLNIVGESSGRSLSVAIEMLLKAQQNGYDVILVYPFLPLEQLLKRANKRAHEEGAGRLPAAEYIREAAFGAAANLSSVLPFVGEAFLVDNSVDKKHRKPVLLRYTKGAVAPVRCSKRLRESLASVNENAFTFFQDKCQTEEKEL